MKKAVVVLAFALLCVVTANADVIGNGPGAVTGSWTQQWIWQGTTINSLKLDLLTGSAWEHPIHGFSNDWTAGVTTPGEVTASGTADVNFFFSTDFITNMNQPLSYRWFGSFNGTVIDQGVASWNGQNWSYVVETATPEPGSLMLLGTGLLGIGSMLRKKFVA